MAPGCAKRGGADRQVAKNTPLTVFDHRVPTGKPANPTPLQKRKNLLTAGTEAAVP
jgi:hypothetical protein